jgi:DNA primase catalytic subunit
LETIKAKRDLFDSYYKGFFTNDKIILPDLKFRHFRFQLFSKKTTFRRIMDVIQSPDQLREKLAKYVPLNAYFTPVKWLNPVYVGHTKNTLDVMLSAPLFFDIDMQDLDPPVFSEVKRNTMVLIEIMKEEYCRTPDLIIFSGRQGFHVYFWDWNSSKIMKLSPLERISEFKRQRIMVLEFLRRKKAVVDERITADPFRIMKIPNTLHGKTGLIAKAVKCVEDFKPKRDATAFTPEEYDSVFKIDWRLYA